MRLDGTDWDQAALHALGARTIADVTDGSGAVVGFDVVPDIDMSGYDAARAEPARRALLDRARAKRFETETGGIVVEGAHIATDRESQSLIAGAYALAVAEPSTTFSFKARDGFVSLDATGMRAIGLAVAQHVQACFRIEAEIVAGIQAGEVTEAEAIDTAFAALA